MSPADVLLLVADQITRHTDVPVYPVPMASAQDAPHGKLSVAGVMRRSKTERKGTAPWPMKLKLRMDLKAQLTGGVVGLTDTLSASWNVTKYLDDVDRLQHRTGENIANSRFDATKATDNDALWEDPEDGSKASFEETWLLEIELPASMAD